MANVATTALATTALATTALTAKPLAAWTMNELLERYPEAAEVLAQHGVNPLTRCHRTAREHMTLKQVLGKVCPVDDVAATLSDLETLLVKS